MKINSNPFMVLLGIILLLIGAGSFLGYPLFPFLQGNIYLTYITIAVAVVLALLVFTSRIKENVGILLIVIWLALMVVLAMNLLEPFSYSDIILSMLPIGAGFFLLVGL